MAKRNNEIRRKNESNRNLKSGERSKSGDVRKSCSKRVGVVEPSGKMKRGDDWRKERVNECFSEDPVDFEDGCGHCF